MRYALKLAYRTWTRQKFESPGFLESLLLDRGFSMKGLGIGDFAERGETSEMAETITRPSGDTM